MSIVLNLSLSAFGDLKSMAVLLVVVVVNIAIGFSQV